MPPRPVPVDRIECPHGHPWVEANIYTHPSGVKSCRVCRMERSMARDRALRAEAIAAYGGACVCCGEAEPAFLELDHVNNDGCEHRRTTGSHIERWAKRHGWPPVLQVLCGNCHRAKTSRGTCPHRTQLEVAS